MRRLLVIGLTAFVALSGWAGGRPQAAPQTTLVVWDQFSGESENAAVEAIHALFLERRPNVSIERNTMSADELAQVLRPALQAGSGPDVFYSEAGIGFVGPALRAKLIMDLNEAWETRGWDDRFFSMAREIPTVAGITYGIGHQLEFVPIYYNKNLFGQLGLRVPRTIAELESVAQRVKDAGKIPFAWGGVNWWPNTNLTTAVLWAWLGQDVVQEGLYEGGRWDRPETITAVRTVFVDWVRRGFYAPNAEALAYGDMLGLFHRGEAAMLFTGSWIVGNLRQNIRDFEVGSFVWPVPVAGQSSNTVTYVGSAYMVSANTKVPELAIDYLDFVLGDPAAAKIWYEVGKQIPPLKVGIDIRELNADPLVEETYMALTSGDINITAGFTMSAPPAVTTFLESSVVKAMIGQATPEQWVRELQSLWDQARAAGETIDTFRF